jgi:hypothetical protein
VTHQATRPLDWRDWDSDAWGSALLRHYFAGYDARPVSRLAISQEELAKAAAAPESESSSVRDAFLDAVRCDPATFKRRLSSASLQPWAWDRRQPPPFLALLFFSCFAAANMDADIADQGVYRERLRQLLKHNEGTSYLLGDLPLLWEAFADWLSARHDVGEPYRTLALPDRGGMKRIGYSLRLAFPRRADRVRLREVLAAFHTSSCPTVPEAFQALARARERFSSDFQHVYDRARAALAASSDLPELQALWSAILEAIALAPRSDRQGPRIRYQLLAQEDDLGRIDPYLVSTGASSGIRRGVQFTLLDEPFGEFDHFLAAGDGSTALIAKLLLVEALEDKTPGIGASPVMRAVKEEVLLFRQADSATWVLSLTRPVEGKIRAIVKGRRETAFSQLLPARQYKGRDTCFEGWREFGSFDASDLAEPREGDAYGLSGVRCLQRVELGPQLHLSSGIRVDGGYLGIEGLMPDVHCTAADHVNLIKREERRGEGHLSVAVALEPMEEGTGAFGWPKTHGDSEGTFVLTGLQSGRAVAQREVTFYSRGLRHDFARPTALDRWLIEDVAYDLVPAKEMSDIYLAAGVGPVAQPPSVETTTAQDPSLLFHRSVDEDSEHDRFVEALSAITVARKGIAEVDLIELLGKTISDANGFGVWGVLRAWSEAGYFDSLSRRQWRGRVYFPRHPKLVLIQEPAAQSVRVILHGLAPYRLRGVVRETFARSGATPLPGVSLSRFVPMPPSWRFESLQHATAATGECRELSAVSARLPRDLADAFSTSNAVEASPSPGYECELSWNWEGGGFRRLNSKKTDDVRIEYLTRRNGPDVYVVAAHDLQFATRSRSWALLNGFRLAGRDAFVPFGTSALIRVGDDGPQIPLPLARAIALSAGIVGGPGSSADLGQFYAYGLENAEVRRWLLAWLNGSTTGGASQRRLAWIRAAMATRSSDAVPIPADLRRRLRDLHSSPDASVIAECRVPRHLLAHVRRAVELAEI